MTSPIGLSPRPGQRVICPHCKREGTYRPLSEGVAHIQHGRRPSHPDQQAVTSKACSVFGADLGSLLPADGDMEGVEVALQVHLLEERAAPRRSASSEVAGGDGPPAASLTGPLSADEALEAVEDALTMANLALDEPALRALVRDPAAAAVAGLLSSLHLELGSVVQRAQQLRRVALSLGAPRDERQSI